MKDITNEHELNLATKYDTYGCIALISACAVFFIPALAWVFMIIGVVLGGEARCNQYSKVGKVFGIIAEIIISIEIIILYVFVINHM